MPRRPAVTVALAVLVGGVLEHLFDGDGGEAVRLAERHVQDQQITFPAARPLFGGRNGYQAGKIGLKRVSHTV